MLRSLFRKALVWVFLLMLLGSLPSILFSGGAKVRPPARGGSKEVLIGFFNGVGNSRDDARVSKDFLEIYMADQMKPAGMIEKAVFGAMAN